MLSDENPETPAHEGTEHSKPKNLAVGTAAFRGASTAITEPIAA